jgi:hypothetical protein
VIERFGNNPDGRDVLWWVDESAAKHWPFGGYSRAPGWILTIHELWLAPWPRLRAVFFHDVEFSDPWKEQGWEPSNNQAANFGNVRVEVELERFPGGARVLGTSAPLDIEQLAMLEAMVARLAELIGAEWGSP